MVDFKDFYILYNGHPRFEKSELIEDDAIRVIIQKYEVVMMTNKGDVFGQPNFGADLLFLLNETKLSDESIESEIKTQLYTWIPELSNLDFTLKVVISEDPNEAKEYMEILFSISDYNVYSVVS